MRRIAVAVLAAALLAGAQPKDDAERLLKAAHNTELVDGDLKGAIKQYGEIVAKYTKADRAVVAMALVRMAECYQKMGDAEARKIYEQVVREYGDQKQAVAEARARLGGAAAAQRSTGDRPVWTESYVDGFGTISPDGRFLTYTDWRTGSLMLRELASGTDRRLTAGTYADGETQFSAISKDGKQVAYQWFLNGNQRYELRVASLAGGGLLESRRLFDNPDFKGVAPYDWSPDGKWIAVFVQRQDRTGQIGLVSVPEGKLRVLKSVDWKGPTKIFFSPDGRYIAYDMKIGDNGRERQIFVMAVDGSGETAAVAHPSINVAMGWSPDGRDLLFASDRSGSMGLWSVPMANGKPQGFATLLRADVGSSWSLGTAASGTLYVWRSTPVYVGVAPIDLDGGKPAASPGRPLQIFITSRGRPDWSKDGKELVYTPCAQLGGGPCTIVIRSMETGQTRELEPPLQYFFFPRFSPDGRSFLTPGTDLKGRQGTFLIDATTGDVTPIAGGPFKPLVQWTADGSGIYHAGGNRVAERNLATGAEREIMHNPPPDALGFSVSPDGKHVAVIASDRKTYHSVMVVPVGGGEARTLLRVNAPEQLRGDQANSPAWTPDGRAVIVAKVLFGDTPKSELWRVPIDGGAPRKLDIDISNWTGDGFRISPDGKRIAFVATAGKQGAEIWAVENFLPARKAANGSK